MDTIEEKAHKAYPENHPCDYECREGFRKACEEYESLPKIRGWVARNKEPDELIFAPGDEKPIRTATYWLCGFTWGYTVIKDIFPEITWESEPVEVELLIRKI